MKPLRADDTVPAKLETATIAKINAAIQAEMKSQKLVGVAIGVIREGKIAYVKGYGFANLAAKTPMTADTVTNWASNSKPLAAVLALQLVEKKLLDLDADVRTYVPEFPKKTATITTRHLLCHQSGMPHYSNGTIIPLERVYREASPMMNPVNALDKFNQSPLLFEPGEKTSYSSYAYVLLSAVIQNAGKKPFAEQVAERITTPLKMTSFEWDTKTAKPTWSTGYVLKNGEVIPAPDEANDWKHGAGGFKSNVTDFARWAQALMTRELITEATETAMWTPQPLRDKTATTWGLGLTLGGRGDARTVSHNGSQSETKTRMVLYPRTKRGLVIMSNCNHADVGKLAAAVESALATK